MQSTTNQATPLANNNSATPLANNQVMLLANPDALFGANNNQAMLLANPDTLLGVNNNQAASAADPHMATRLAVYTAQNIANAQTAAELAGAQSEALDETWGNSITPQQMYGARNLSGSFSAAGKPPLSPRAALSPRPGIMMEQEQNCLEIRSIVSELRQEKKRAEEQRMESERQLARVRETMKKLENFALDTVRENGEHKERLAAKEAEILELNATLRDSQEQVAIYHHSLVGNASGELQEKEVKLESAEERANEFDESTVWQTCKDSKDSPWAPCGLPATGNFDAFTPVGGLSTPPGVSKIQAPTSSHIEERYDSRMTKVETDVNQILMMVSNLQKTIENSASAQASPQTQKTTSPATPETVIKIVPQDWMPEARELPYPCITGKGRPIPISPPVEKR